MAVYDYLEELYVSLYDLGALFMVAGQRCFVTGRFPGADEVSAYTDGVHAYLLHEKRDGSLRFYVVDPLTGASSKPVKVDRQQAAWARSHGAPTSLRGFLNDDTNKRIVHNLRERLAAR